MNLELDHLFVCCALDAPEADRLVNSGFHEGPSNVHSGQGTSCRRFFFQNAYLEFLWVHDEIEARGELVRQTGLWDRWSQRESVASPFGIGMRFLPHSHSPRLPFASWSYRPPYLP